MQQSKKQASKLFNLIINRSLVIKKEEDVNITNKIGRIFKKYNIMEYKSPDDSLNIDTFYKVQAYAALYKSGGDTVDERKVEDITVSIVRERKPLELFKTLEDMNMQITNPYNGVYYINGIMMFSTQVIVTRELYTKENTWIKSLSHNMNMPDMGKLIYKIRGLKSDYEKELADAILEVTLRANKDLIEKMRGDEKMSGALMELAEPWIKNAEIKGRQEGKREGIREGKQEGIREGKREGIQEGKREGIQGTIDILCSLGHDDEEIRKLITKKYNLSEKEMEQYL